MEIKVKTDVGPVKMFLLDAQRQVIFAAAVALTRTAHKISDAESKGISAELDRPKPQTQKAFRVDKATKENLAATISIKSRFNGGLPADEYLIHNIKNAIVPGGESSGHRFMKRSEIMLQAAKILPAGMQTAPGPDAELDAYGNMQRGQIVQILSYFKTFGITPLNSSRMNMKQARRDRLDKRGGYFVVQSKIGKWFPGIYKRSGKEISFLLTFIKAPQYKARFNFYGIAKNIVDADFDNEFSIAFEEAMRTAK